MKRNNKIIENVLECIKAEMQEVEFGSITIELKGNYSKVDVVTNKRKRFEVTGEKKNTEFRKG